MRETKREATRTPLPAPFPVGVRVRYKGDRQRFADLDGKKPLLTRGMEFDIVEISEGRRGSGVVIDFDEEGDPIRDRTQDGLSIYVDARRMRCAIHPTWHAGEWEVVNAIAPAVRA